MQTDSFSRCVAFLLIWLGFYGGWTIVSVPLTLAGAPFYAVHLCWTSGAVGAWMGYRQYANVTAALRPLDDTVLERWYGRPIDWVFLVVGTLLTLGAGAVFIKTHDARPLWSILAVLCVASLLPRKSPDAPPAQTLNTARPPQGVGVLLLGATIILLYLFVLRPDADDAFYLNLPIGLKTASHGMMAFDTMYGVAEWPILGSNYRVESLPVLVAALSTVTGLPVITTAHFVLPLVWCLAITATLVVIGYAFFAQRWWVFAGLSLATGFVLAGTLQNWGVHGIFRLFHGKAPLMMIVFPLVWLLVSRIERLGIPRAFGLLFALQIVATGLTANAVYLAPLALGVLLAARVLAAGKPQFLFLLFAALPALTAGLWLMLVDRPVANQRTAEPDNALALWDMAAHSPTMGLLVLFFGLVACAARVTEQGRFATSYLFVALLFVINPLLWPIYDSHVTGALNFRLWWALPVPMMLAAAATWVLGAHARRWSVLALGLAAAMALFWPSSIFRTEGTDLRLSLHKVPEPAFQISSEVRAIVRDGRLVLAPEHISELLTVATPRVRPVFVRALYLDQSLPLINGADIQSRQALADWIDGRDDMSDGQLSEMLSRLSVGLVVLPPHRDFPLVGEEVKLLHGYRFIRIPKSE